MDKNCTLAIDEMSLKTNLCYNIYKDQIIGYDTVNTGHNLAKNVLVIMAQGITKKWKQPIAYFFVKSTFSGEQLKNTIIECVSKMKNVGITVRAIVSDQGSNFIELTRNLEITAEKPFFCVSDMKVFYFFDTPHLLKSLRNNLMKYDFLFNGQTASWTDIESFYKKDSTQQIRCAPKLQNGHIYPNTWQKMNVYYAAQIFSHTVSAAMCTHVNLGALPKSAMGTVNILQKIDTLFDVLNSSCFGPRTKQFKRPYDGSTNQIKFLNEMLNLLENLELKNRIGKDNSKKIKCINGLKITINATMQMFTELKNVGLKFLATRRVNQDSLENFFGTVRQQGGNCRNPTPIQFSRAFKKLVALNFFAYAEGANCENDENSTLVLFSEWKNLSPERHSLFSNKSKSFKICEETNMKKSFHDYRQLNLPEKNALTYVAGYMKKKLCEHHTCNFCDKNSDEMSNSAEYTFISMKAFDKNNAKLFSPSNQFLKYITALEQNFEQLYEKYGATKGVGWKIYSTLIHVEYTFSTCEKFPHDFFLKLFIRLRIYYTIKFANKNLLVSKKYKDKFNIVKHV